MLGWVTSDYVSRGLGWVGSVKSWVGLGYRKWTHGHIWYKNRAGTLDKIYHQSLKNLYSVLYKTFSYI